MKDKIREIIEMHDSLVEYKHGNEHCILPEHYDELAEEIVKLFAIPDVINQEHSCETCIWCASDKMCKTCDEDWSNFERSC